VHQRTFVRDVREALVVQLLSHDVLAFSLHSAHANLTINMQLYTLQLTTTPTNITINVQNLTINMQLHKTTGNGTAATPTAEKDTSTTTRTNLCDLLVAPI
jgi:hypothetical protein